jgi:galactoside O-acetyltransferase
MIFIILKNFFNKYKLKKIFSHNAVKIDKSTILLAGTTLRLTNNVEPRSYLTIGKKCLLKCNFIFESNKGEIIIGNNVHIGNADIISRDKITIGNDVTMAWGITIYDHNSHSLIWDERKYDNEQCYNDFIKYNNNILNKNWENVKSNKIEIHDKVWIGFDVLILKGVIIGEGAIIGAKSIVTKNVPPWTVVAGNPAKIVKHLK